jgi:putative two-component system response regulator
MPSDTGQIRLLLVDSDRTFRDSIGSFLGGKGHQVTAADSAQAALLENSRASADVVLAELGTADVPRADLIQRLRALDGFLPVVVYSDSGDARVMARAFELGASDFLKRPMSLPSLERVLRRAFERAVASRREVRERGKALEEGLRRADELEREQHRLKAVSTGVAEALINAMEAKSVYLRGHSERVASLAASLASEMQLDDETVEAVRLAGRLHDIGKIGIKEHILDKPGRLTAEEYDHVKEHVRIGMEILQPLTYLGPVLEYVRDHQERPDGSGYPRQLTGKQISAGARIVGGADVFDALTSRRAHREPMTVEQALEFLGAAQDTAIAADVYAALVRVVTEGRTLVFLHEEPPA